MEAPLVQSFEGSPSPEDFSAIESANVPAVFVSAIKEWTACSAWDPRAGGLDYLLNKVGLATVDAMLSRSGPVFYGDLRSHERVHLPFSDFIKFCQQNSQLSSRNDLSTAEHCKEEASALCDPSSTSAEGHLYLAQVPILTVENKEKTILGALIDDIKTPVSLGEKALASINLWMNNAPSRSSIHYDPHHNLLCVVSGKKQVFLWPPSAGCFLYPMAVFGEASNHSSLDIQNPDFSRYPLAKGFMKYAQKAILHAGDALFIPEGWFHQVDSEDLTIGVNFWWKSTVMSSMAPHMDAYYLRHILSRLVDREMEEMLPGKEDNPEEAMLENIQKINEDSKGQSDSKKGDDNKEGLSLESLEPLELQYLNVLVSLVHERVNVSGQSQDFTQDSSVSKEENQGKNVCDPFAAVLHKMRPQMLCNVFLAMVHSFPRTLEALVLRSLSPLAAEILTRKFDEIDQKSTKEEQCEFYRQVYSVFDDQFAAMDSILSLKESFAFKAFQNVIDKYLGVDVSKPK